MTPPAMSAPCSISSNLNTVNLKKFSAAMMGETLESKSHLITEKFILEVND